MKPKSAVTLLEVLVASAVGLLVFAVLIAIFRQMVLAGQLGESRISSQLRARQAVRRVIPYLRFATAPNTAVEAIYHPDVDATASNVVFSVPENLLQSGPAFNPRSPVYYLYQIRHDITSKKLLLQDFYAPTQSNTLAIDIAAFNVTRNHLNGLLVRLRTEAQSRDARGFSKLLPYQIEEAVEIPH